MNKKSYVNYIIKIIYVQLQAIINISIYYIGQYINVEYYTMIIGCVNIIKYKS